MAPKIAADQVSYEDLYARWEQGNWRATEIDFTVDRDHWNNTFSEMERRASLWTYSMFFYGEDAVADNLSPYIDAAPREEQNTSWPRSRSTRRDTRCCSRGSCAKLRRPA